MPSKWLIGLLIFIFGSGAWMFVHPSYQKSIEARFAYSMGEYDNAYLLAKESFALDSYNKMAATVMAQSQMALKYVRYNNDAEKYKKEIHRIAAQKNVTPQERAKIKMMTQIMIDAYANIGASVIIDQELVEKARSHYEQFKILNNELASPR